MKITSKTFTVILNKLKNVMISSNEIYVGIPQTFDGLSVVFRGAHSQTFSYDEIASHERIRSISIHNYKYQIS